MDGIFLDFINIDLFFDIVTEDDGGRLHFAGGEQFHELLLQIVFAHCFVWLFGGNDLPD